MFNNFWVGLLVLLTSASIYATAVYAQDGPKLSINQNSINHDTLGVIVNQSDPLSRQLADYYRNQRSIPIENIIYVDIPIIGPNLPREEFEKIYRVVKANTNERIQAYAIMWTAPYRVECMSITSAFAFGFDDDLCSSECRDTRISPLYASEKQLNYHWSGVKPAMMVAADEFAQGKALIDRGVKADGTQPYGSAYLLATSDDKRNVRKSWYPEFSDHFSLANQAKQLRVRIIEDDYIVDKNDILFYFTGVKQVKYLGENHFLNGAVGDHLTSVGGMLTDSYQMSSLRWLEAGATGSYGTVVEPCNILGKFTNPNLLAKYYLDGAPLIEAYWKSVQMPGQGVFIGEPLARPFAK